MSDFDLVRYAVADAVATIALDDLRYWSVARQEAYATAQIASEQLAPQ